MLRNELVLLTILPVLPVLALLAACGGEPAPTSGNSLAAAAGRPVPASSQPLPTLQATATSLPPTPTVPSPGSPMTESAGTFPIATSSIPVSVVRVAEPTEIPTPTVELSSTIPPDTTEEDIATILSIIEEYWEALNEYDVDRAIPMLEESYRTAEEELIRKDTGRMKLFRAKLGVSEETPLSLKENGEYETYLSVKTPVDTRRVLMVFRKIEGQWWIGYSDLVE